MARYIDADKMQDFLAETNSIDDWLVSQYNADWISSFIESQPTADVMEVVRCKDCKYWELNGLGKNLQCKIGYCLNDNWENYEFYCVTYEHDFCSYGERKEGEKQ